MSLEFDEATHTYTLDGVQLPSVTTVLADLKLVDVSKFRPEHRHRGTLRHVVTELYDHDDLDEASLDESEVLGQPAGDIARGALDAWRRFRAESGFKPSLIEYRVWSSLGYAGTVDRIGTLPDGRVVLLDIKGSFDSPSYGLQTAAYTSAYEERSGNAIDLRGAVHLLPNGSYRLRVHSRREDIHEWRHLLAEWKSGRWRESR